MPTPREAFQARLEKLIAKFEADQAHYLSKGYGEAQARIDFITPLFKALGCYVEEEIENPVYELHGTTQQEQQIIADVWT